MPEFDDGQTETALPSHAATGPTPEAPDVVVETDVLVVGSGPAGASAALFLSSLGVSTIMITKYRWTANTPRAHITNQRTMEIFRDLGIEDQVLADATPHELVGDTVFCTTIAGEEIGRILTWETHPAREADARLASPSLTVDIPQTYLEPILVKNASQRGAQSRFSTEYLSHTQDADGVSTRVLDRVTGTEYTIRSKYLIGGDGARSQVAADIGLPMEGAMDIAGSMNITFKADLTHLVGHRPSVLYWVLQPGSDVGGIGAGLVRMVRPWNEWLIVWGYDIAGEPPQLDDDAAAAEIVRQLVGARDLDVEITGYSLWGNNQMYATHLQQGRVFCAGDAVHRHPPSNGLGSNTSVQDSYNLAWKIAAVLNGQAALSLLDTYSAERAPVAEQIVLRANRSGGEFRFMEVLGVLDAETPEAMQAAIDERKANTPAGAAKRAALVEAMDLKHYEFNAHGVDMGQFYQSAAIVPDGSPRPVDERDPELYYKQSTVPGARFPHVWVADVHGHKRSTHDLVPYGQFTLVTGIAGEAWADAAAKVADELGVPLEAVVIGPGRDVIDTYYDWARMRGVEESGAVLVRPDSHVAWRAQTLADDPAGALGDALRSVLGRGGQHG